MAGQGLADLLSGAAGAPVNRSGLNAFVANSQATNSLRSAQTEEALLNAQRAQDEQVAAGQLEDAFVKSGARPADAHLMATAAKMHSGSAVNAMDMFKAYNATVLGDPSKLNTPDQTAASQAISGKLAEPAAAPNNMIVPAGVTPNIQQSPQGVAQTAQTKAMTGLDIARAEDEHAKATHASQPGANLDAGTTDMGADVVMADPTKMSQFGSFGQNGQAIKTQINNRIAQKLQAAGMQPTDMIRQRAIAKASVGSAGQAAKQAETLDAFMPLVRSNGERIVQLLSQVGDDGADMPILAGLQRSLGRNLGNDDLAELHSVFTTYQNEVARLLAAGPSMNGVISDHARSEIQAMAPENMTTSQARRVINRVNIETGIRRNSVQSALVNSANEQLPVTAAPPGGASPQGPSPAAGGATGAPIPLDQYLKSKGY